MAMLQKFRRADVLAASWRELEREALEVASVMVDPAARRYMLFISEGYRLLAERAKSRETAAQEVYD